METAIRVLIIEDSEDDALLIIRALNKGGYQPSFERVENAESMRKAIEEKAWDVILCDYQMPKFSGLAAIALLKEVGVDIPLIMISGVIGEEMAVECMRLGAHDYVMKGNLTRLPSAVSREIKEAKIRATHREAVKALRESEDKFKSFFDHSIIGKSITYLSGKMEANKAFSEMLGYSPDEFRNCKWQDITHPDDVALSQGIVSSIVAGEKESKRFIKRYIHKNGSVVWTDISTTLRRDQEGQPIYLMASVSDITERKRAEEERIRLEKNLVQAQKMESIGTLAGGIAHDFNNILTAILGFTELAIAGVDKVTAVKEDLQEVYAAGLRAKDLVSQILTFARQSDEEVRPIQVDSILKEVLKFLRSSIPATINIKQKIEHTSLIMGNATQLHQIIMNLCTNAAQAMEDNGGILEITMKDITLNSASGVGKVKPGNYLEIVVSDTGSGIEPHIVGKIFEPYFTTKNPGEGTGMGLALVHGIIESYGGKILVESTLGKGTVFKIYLPTCERSKVNLVCDSKELPMGQERILFVDDEVPVVKMASRILGQLGYSVTSMTDSLEALALFQTKPNDFDLVISDVTMPGMAGDILANRLVQIRPDIPIILCTGYSKKISAATASEVGVNALAAKPLVKTDLAKTVRKVLDGPKGSHP